ncbi:Dehydrogenase [Aeromicrobium sp. 9AM]|nr:Dehydrogenase [Aeromicrobium sp. 9AM]
MGQALATTLLQAGHGVTVWNRTHQKARQLVESGAEAHEDLHEALSGSQYVLICLRDYEAVHSVFRDLSVLRPDHIVINLTTGAPQDARDMAETARDADLEYLEGAILTPTPTIGTPAATILYAGSEATFGAAGPITEALGGSPHYLGPDFGRPAALDLALLDVFSTTVSGVVHGFALAKAEGIAASTFAAFAKGMSALLPEIIERFSAQIDAQSFPGDRSTIASAKSGVGHIIEAATGHGLNVAALKGLENVIDQAISAGYENDGLARLSQFMHN